MNKLGRTIAETFTNIGQSLNIFSLNDYYKINDVKIKSDNEALKEDWDIVGNALREYMK